MLYSVLKKQVQKHNRRSFLLLTGKLGFFSLVGWKLFDIQLLNQKNIILYPKKTKLILIYYTQSEGR